MALWSSSVQWCDSTASHMSPLLLSLPPLHDPHLHGNQCKMAPGKVLCWLFSHRDACFLLKGWEWVLNYPSADNSLGIRVTSFTHPPFIWPTRPRSLLRYSDYMQSCDYCGGPLWICKPGDKASWEWSVFINTKARHWDIKASPVRKTLC